MATKIIKEIVTDVGGNTTIEYSDDTTQKYNVADVVTAQVNPLTGGIGNLLVGGFAYSSPYLEQYMSDVFAPPSQEDTPVIVQATAMATGLSSPAIFRPYICNTGAQITNSAAQSDPVFNFAPGVYHSSAGGNADLAMYGSIRPGGDSNFSRWPVVAEFNTGAGNSIVEVACYGLNNNTGGMPLIEVGGELVSRVTPIRTATGNGWRFTLTFPVAKSRRIRLHGLDGFAEVRVPTGEVLTKPSIPSPKNIAIIGDSYSDGASTGFAGGAGAAETFSWQFARMLGCSSITAAGIGGTGFVAGTTTNSYKTRVATVLSKSPDVLIVNGSINDGTAGTGVAAAVTEFLALVASIPTVYVIGTMLSSYEENHDQVKVATIAAGRKFIDMRSFLSGTGNRSNRKLDGNRDVYLLPDNAHPTQYAHQQIARRCYLQSLVA